MIFKFPVGGSVLLLDVSTDETRLSVSAARTLPAK